ncbi:MAG: acyltransferase [Bacteroidales bacterium]|nr:acyltransferase [Bacteroidales bacterium]
MLNNSKQHYAILDGLRGVAALMVVGYHLFEAIAFAAGAPEQKMFHGFLAVDFFLMLSGFVMGYAYDDRWDTMSVGGFFRRRLIRLHPMVVMGVVIGAIAFIGQGCLKWDGTQASAGSVALTILLSLFLIPSPSSLDVRGNTELFPLNGPHWSLFFEYVGSILYALLLRRLSDRALKVWVAAAAVALLAMGLLGPDGSIAYGWSSQPVNMLGGLLRMTFEYPAGLLLARMFRNRKESTGTIASMPSSWAFVLFGAILAALLCVPSLGSFKVAYEVLCVTVAFPLLVWNAAKVSSPTEGTRRTMSFLGDLSYPLYAIHYPFIYMYIAWIETGAHPFGEWPGSNPICIGLICLAVGFICMKFYDKPVRRFLSRK